MPNGDQLSLISTHREENMMGTLPKKNSKFASPQKDISSEPTIVFQVIILLTAHVRRFFRRAGFCLKI